MNRLSLAALIASALIAGCGGMPTDPKEQGSYFANNAKANAKIGSGISVLYHVERAIERPEGSQKIRSVFAADPLTKTTYIRQLDENISQMSAPTQLPRVYESIQAMRSSAILSDDETKRIVSAFESRVLAGNKDDGIPFLLGDEGQSFEVLQSPQQQDLIFKRTLRFYSIKAGARHVDALLRYALRNGAGSPDEIALRTQLSALNFTNAELDAVAKHYPEFAASRRSQITSKVYFTVKNGDRLFADDILEKLKGKLRGIIWLPTASPGVIELSIERVRNDEKVLPETTQTITYAYSDVNVLNAALFMPRNASYMFDLSSGGATIDYGYVITARQTGKPAFERVARGKVEAAYAKCLNPRVQNVFGGTTAAAFVANDDMQARCSKQTAPSLDDLRADILEKLAAQVLEIPTIRATHDMNL